MWKRSAKSTSEIFSGLHPLDEIRQEEAKVTSQLFQARQQAEDIRLAAKQQAEQLKQQAGLEGTRDGQNARASQFAEAQKQANQIIAQASAIADGFSTQMEDQVENSVRWAEDIIFGIAPGAQAR